MASDDVECRCIQRCEPLRISQAALRKFSDRRDLGIR